MNAPNSFRAQPDERGHFGDYGGRYVAETLMPLILDLEREYRASQVDPAFKAEFDNLMTHYVGRPSPMYYAERLTETLRESAPRGQGAENLFQARRAEPHRRAQDQQLHWPDPARQADGQDADHRRDGRGQHGVATATVAARFGLPCTIFMGARDIERQAPNVSA